jgi:mRNA interferase MazF
MNRGDIVPFKGRRDPRGHEQRGRRYAVVLQSDALDEWSTVVVAPTTTSGPGAFFRPTVNLRGKQGLAVVDQMLAVDRTRLGEVVGSVSIAEMQAIEGAVRFVLGLR